MNWLYSILGYPLGWIMWLAYKVVPNYLVALILFTLITKLLMLPLSIKQQKSTAQMAMYQPKIKEIQAKYANNRVKMNDEMQKLYAEEGYNPMSGCLPLLIQFPILFGLIDVVYKPLTHLLRLSSEAIAQLTTIATDAGLMAGGTTSFMSQISVFDAVKTNPGAFSSVAPDVLSKIESLDMSFLGINLAQKPDWTWPLLLIPLLAGLTAFAASFISTKIQGSAMDASARTTNWMMMLIMPAMSLWFTTAVSCGVGVYWIVNNVFMAVQSVILNKFFNTKDLLAKAQSERDAQRDADRERREAAHERARQRALARGDASAASLDPATMSEKEANRLKIAEARRRMAEKYGDEYVDVSDADMK